MEIHLATLTEKSSMYFPFDRPADRFYAVTAFTANAERPKPQILLAGS